MSPRASSSAAGTVVGAVIILALVAATLYGGWRFVVVVLDGRSPATLAWIAMGLLLFAVGVTAAAGLASAFHADDERAGPVVAVTGVVVAALGLGASYYWAEIREPALVKALGAACRGEGVTAAPAPEGVRRVVVLDDRGHKVDWTTVDTSWRAAAVDEADLVACADRRSELIETCHYRALTGGPTSSVDRLAETVTVRVVEARTASPLGQFTLRDEPRACRKTEKEGQGDLRGHVSFAAFSKALAPYLGR